MKFISICQAFLVTSFSYCTGYSQSVYPVSASTETVLLNGSWDFKYIKGGTISPVDSAFYKPEFTGNDWGTITVPANWELQGKAEPDYAQNLKEGIGLYRTLFKVPQYFSEKRIFIRFEGVLYAYELFINGKYVRRWESAFNSHQFDITSFVDRNKVNYLAVKVLTHTPRQTHLFDISDNWSLSGIFRDVLLLSVPNVHFTDLVVRSEVFRDNSAKLKVSAFIGAFQTSENKEFILEVSLLDPSGKPVYSNKQRVNLSFGKDSLQMETVLKAPLLWTAETPLLYSLNLSLYNGKHLIQRIHEKAGIREVTIQDGVFKINNTAIKLKGVNMHEINPERGSALTDKDRLVDLTLAKKANINFIRTSHYPHHPRFFELCDSLGLYVICEIPFNFRPKGVTENLDYLPHLLHRAEATISRNKNHPSIIIWSIGNENHYAEIYKRVAAFAELKDPTRPRCFPQAPKVFAQDWKVTPDVFTILAPHYLQPAQLDALAKESKRPIIMTEYGHSLGLSTEDLEENWAVVRQHPNIAGASVWMWSDQGIKRKRSTREFLADVNPKGVWVDSTTLYDGFGEYGNDGIVYADRHPQSDYWLTRKVYSPVWISAKKIIMRPGQRTVSIELENRFDFISLRGFLCKWTLKHFRNKIEEGNIDLSIPAKCSGKIEIPIPNIDFINEEYFLSLSICDASGALYETNLQMLGVSNNKNDLIKNTSVVAAPVKFKKDKKEWLFSSVNYAFNTNANGKLTLIGNSQDTVLNGLPVLRVGRKPTITLAYQADKIKNTFYWNPYLLTQPVLLWQQMKKINDGYELLAGYRWTRQDKENEYIDGSVKLTIENGEVTCDYELTPHNASGEFMELGLGFSISERCSAFRWLGEGPFVSVPGKTLYNERDSWALSKWDINFNGNRANTDLAAFYNDEHSGIGFKGEKRNFGVELVNNTIIFTDNVFVAGFGNKVNLTKYPVKADKVIAVQGRFSILFLGNNTKLFNDVFFPLDDVKAEKPFFRSYGF